MPSITLLDHSQQFELPTNSPLTELDQVLTFGCRIASCGACAIEVIEGHENLTPMADKEKNFLQELGLSNGQYRLACQCKVKGNITIKQP